jgi:uncharacterized membrane protein HdeD (DUF308 family)
MTSATVGGRQVGADIGWVSTLFLGLAALVLGVVLVLNPFASAWTLALLVGFGLIADGVLDIVRSRQAHRTAGVVAGALLVLGGIVAIAWPDVTLWALALIVGFSIVLAGAATTTAALMDKGSFRGHGWLLASGVVSLVIGVIAVAWPEATVVVLAVLFGLHIAAYGLMEIMAALELRKVGRRAA